MKKILGVLAVLLGGYLLISLTLFALSVVSFLLAAVVKLAVIVGISYLGYRLIRNIVAKV